MRRKMIEDGNLNLHKGIKRTRNDNYGVNKIFKSLEKVIDSLKQKQPHIVGFLTFINRWKMYDNYSAKPGGERYILL